jgi:hypothetical protein
VRPAKLQTSGSILCCLLLLALHGCQCGEPPAPVLTVQPDGQLLLQEGHLAPLPDGERLAVLLGEGERQVAEILVGAPAGEGVRAVTLRCAPMGGLVPGRYPVRRPDSGVHPCERWGAVVDPRVPTVKLAPGLVVPEGTILRIVRPRPNGGESVLWGRLGPAPADPGVHTFELLLPFDPPPLVAGEAVDMGDADGHGLSSALASAARGMAAQALKSALDALALALDNPEAHQAASRLFVVADKSAERVAVICPGEVATAEQVLPATVWSRWVGELEKRFTDAGPYASPRWDAAARITTAHLPALDQRILDQPDRAEDVARLRVLLTPPPPHLLPGSPPGSTGRRPPAPSRPTLQYLELERLPEALKTEYRHVRAIPVNTDPARFADRRAEEIRQEQVQPLLEHAGRYVEQAVALAASTRQAPDPQLSCRLLFALDNIARGQQVYRATDEDLRQAQLLSTQLTTELLQEGRRECYPGMRGSP